MYINCIIRSVLNNKRGPNFSQQMAYSDSTLSDRSFLPLFSLILSFFHFFTFKHKTLFFILKWHFQTSKFLC